jgi:hypothetical protein
VQSRQMIQHTIVQPCFIFNAISIGSFGTSFDRYFTRRQMLAIFSTTAFLVRIHPMLALTTPLTNCSRNYKNRFAAPSISETDRIVPGDENDVTINPKIEFLTNHKTRDEKYNGESERKKIPAARKKTEVGDIHASTPSAFNLFFTSTIAADRIEEDCRKACGGHGFLQSSGLPVLVITS